MSAPKFFRRITVVVVVALAVLGVSSMFGYTLLATVAGARLFF